MPKFETTIKFSYSAPEHAYPQGSSPETMARLDKLNFRGNTESLLEMLASTEYSVEVVVVDNG